MATCSYSVVAAAAFVLDKGMSVMSVRGMPPM